MDTQAGPVRGAVTAGDDRLDALDPRWPPVPVDAGWPAAIQMFDEVVSEPVPDEFLEILRRADSKSGEG